MPILPVRPDPDLSCLRGFRWQNVAIGDLHAKRPSALDGAKRVKDVQGP